MFEDLVKHQDIVNGGDTKMIIGWIFVNLKRYYSNLDEAEVEKALVDADKAHISKDFVNDEINRKIEAMKLKKRIESPQSHESRVEGDNGLFE
jgi:hypothetical protein